MSGINKKGLILLILLATAALITNAHSAVIISTYVVDGISNNQNVVIYKRAPLFTIEYTNSITSFTIRVSTDPSFEVSSSTIWEASYSTTTANTKFFGSGKYRTSTSYAGNPLLLNLTYYWDISLFDIDGATYTVPASGSQPPFFYTVVSNISFSAPTAAYDITVDWNNPFNPLLTGENGKTKFRYFTKDEKSALVRVFTLSGEYVATAKHFAPADGDYYKTLPGQTYTAEWDGRDYEGKVVPAGIYLVNLAIQGEAKGVTRRVVVIKK